MSMSAQQHLLFFKMFKPMTLLVLVALAACVFSMDGTRDQETAEQYYRIHGVDGATTFNRVRALPYTGYPYIGYPAAYTGYPATFSGVKNVVAAAPYSAYAYPVPGYYGAYPAFGSLPHLVKVNAMETRSSLDQDNKGTQTLGRNAKQSDFFARITGKYCLAGQENFEKYLEAIGMSMEKIAVAMKQTSCANLSYQDDIYEWSVQVLGESKDYDFKFRLGEEFKRVAVDGRHVTDLFKLVEEGDKFKVIQKESWGTNEAVIVHEFEGDDWNVAITLGDIKSFRHFRRG